MLFVDRVDKKTFVNLTGAQLLGPALSPGAVYVSSVLDNSTEILCIKGNVTDKMKPSQSANSAAAAGPSSRYTAAVVTSVQQQHSFNGLFFQHNLGKLAPER